MANTSCYAADLVNEALGHLGVYTGDALSASDANTALFTLQTIMDSWGGDTYTYYNFTSQAFTVTGGQNTYTFGLAGSGPGGTSPNLVWTQTNTLPTLIENVSWATNNPTMPAEYLVFMETYDQYAATSIKKLQSNVTATGYVVYGNPWHTIYIYPTPSTSFPLTVYAGIPVPQLTALNNTVQLLPGYREALILELAIKCSGKFGAPLPEWIIPEWQACKNRLRSTNQEILDTPCDSAVLANSADIPGASIPIFWGGM